MRKISLIAVAAALACGGSSNNNANTYVANMTADQEVPPKTSSGTGTATFTVNGTNVDYVITFTGLTSAINNAHIHSGASGTANAPVTSPFPLPSPAGTSGTLTGSFPASDIKEGSAASGIHAGDLNSLVAAMKTGNAYANIHTVNNSGGEIRGQILPK